MAKLYIVSSTPLTHLTVKNLAVLCGIWVQPLLRWRMHGGAPKFVDFGPRAVRYCIAVVEEWASAATYSDLAARAAAASKCKSETTTKAELP